ncbi:MAG: periplasmic heavy metal sensor [Bacteroidota bacterium]|nr:periplasmic heavy metal sensor [Bacteroidota bacterium]
MKKLTISRQLLYALVILLVVTNLVTVFSVARFLNDHKTQTTVSESGEEIPGFHRTKLFSDELNLDEDQQYIFRGLNRTFNQTANQVYRDMSHLRVDLVDEMGLTNPDTVRLQYLAEEIGNLHTELKTLTTDFYLGLKAVCSPEQQDLLFHQFRNLLNTEEDLNTPRGRGTGRGYGRRNQYIN